MLLADGSSRIRLALVSSCVERSGREPGGRSNEASPAAFTLFFVLAIVFTAIFVRGWVSADSCRAQVATTGRDCEGVGLGVAIVFVPAIVFAVLAFVQGVRLLEARHRDRRGL